MERQPKTLKEAADLLATVELITAASKTIIQEWARESEPSAQTGSKSQDASSQSDAKTKDAANGLGNTGPSRKPLIYTSLGPLQFNASVRSFAAARLKSSSTAATLTLAFPRPENRVCGHR